MRYFELLERAERLRSDRKLAKQKSARNKIASADHKRSAAAARYQDELKASSDAIAKARAALREGSLRCYALRDRRGVLLGWIEAIGRLIQARDKSGAVVGWYDPRLNVTRDRTGKLMGTGDLLSAILVCGR
jgi:hypothetical protein